MERIRRVEREEKAGFEMDAQAEKHKREGRERILREKVERDDLNKDKKHGIGEKEDSLTPTASTTEEHEGRKSLDNVDRINNSVSNDNTNDRVNIFSKLSSRGSKSKRSRI